MNGATDVFSQSIKLLTESQFNEFVTLYIQCIYETKEAFISNGPYDGGIDLTIYLDGKEIKRNVQITVQRTGLKEKILSDAQKAHNNVGKYGYLSKLDFYSREEISNETQNKCRAKSEVEYGIDVSIYDCRRLASMVGSYPVLIDFLKKCVISQFSVANESIDVNTRLVYDVLSRQSEIVDIKHAIVEACFISCLFQKGQASFDEIVSSLDAIFYKKIRRSYYENLAGNLNSAGVIIVGGEPRRYRLTDKTAEMYLLLDQRAQNCYLEIINAVHDVIQKHGLIDLDEGSIFQEMTTIYDSIYQEGVSEIKSEGGAVKNESQEIIQRSKFEAFLKRNGVGEGLISVVADEVFAAFETNSVFGKASASRTLIKLFNDNKIKAHRSLEKRTLIIDTPVLIRWICLLFNKAKDYSEPFFQTVQRMKTVVGEMKDDLRLETMDGYVAETAILLRKAIRLSRYESIMRSLGPSRNVFFNYYLEADRQTSYGSCERFVADCLDMDYIPAADGDLDAKLTRIIKERLSNIGIETVKVSSIDISLELSRDYEMALINTSGEKKSESAKTHDLQAIIHMSHDFGSDCEPSIITSDASFINARDSLGKKYDKMANWLVFTPQNISRSLSLENFSINTAEISTSIRIAMESAIQNNPYGKSLVDVVSEVTSNWKNQDMHFANLISRLRKSLHSNIIRGENNQNAIDELLSFVIRHYSRVEDSEETLRLMFGDKVYSPQIKRVLTKYMSDFRESDSNVTASLISELDSLLQQVELVDIDK